jgi:voltage-gated potassium channel Kch
MDLGEQAEQVKFLIRDRGSNFTAAFGAVLAGAGIRTVLCNIRTPRMNAVAERWIGGCRREPLDRTLWNQPHLRRTLRQCEIHHKQHRPHRSLHGAAPLKPLPEPVDLDLYHVRRQAQVGGMINEYRLVACHGRGYRHAQGGQIRGRHLGARTRCVTPSGATLVAMSDIAQRSGQGAGDDADADDPHGRLAAYVARTQTALDLLALATLWIVVVPPGDFSTSHDVRAIVLIIQAAVRVVYGIDITIRSVLARRHVHYLLTHPLGIGSVIFPPVRVIFSLRLVRSVFRRGHLSRFLLAASVLVLNGAIIVYLFERHAPGSNIHTLGESLWWSAVTVTTVGYGDFFPVTTAGRITACFIMGIGLLTLAVVTAQVASSFVAQAPSRARRGPRVEAATPEVTLAGLDRRLARIEELLTAAPASSSPRAAGAPERESGPDRS